jgi:hypothetical protein
MHEIEVLTVSAAEASDGIAELRLDGEQIAYTHYDFDDGDLMLRIEPRHDGPRSWSRCAASPPPSPRSTACSPPTDVNPTK